MIDGFKGKQKAITFARLTNIPGKEKLRERKQNGESVHRGRKE